MLKQYKLTANDGKEISVAEWKNEDKEIKGLVQIVHGMAEHSLRYKRLAEVLTGEGYLVFCSDNRAHGETDKDTLGYSKGDNFNDTVNDLNTVSESYKNAYKGKKLLIFGHSYGSFLTQAYLQKYNNYDAAIISGSARMPSILVLVGKITANIGASFNSGKNPAKLLDKITFGAYNKKFKTGNFVTSIKEEAELYKKDKLCGFICSYNFYKGFFKGLSKLYTKKGLNNIDRKKPILILSGKNDPVGENGKLVYKLYNTYVKIGASVKMKLFENSRHEYLNDIDRNIAYEEIKNFISENF